MTAIVDWDPLKKKHAERFDPRLYQLKAEKGQPRGYASLGKDGLVPASQLPAASASVPAGLAMSGGFRFEWLNATRIQLVPHGGDGIARVPVRSGTSWVIAEIPGALTWDIASGLSSGSPASGKGYELRVETQGGGVSPRVVGTLNGGSYVARTGYTHVSDVLGFVSYASGSIQEFRHNGADWWYVFPYVDIADFGIELLSGGKATTPTAINCSAYVPASAQGAHFWARTFNDSTTERTCWITDSTSTIRAHFRMDKTVDSYNTVDKQSYYSPFYGDPATDHLYYWDPSTPTDGLFDYIRGFRLEVANVSVTLESSGGGSFSDPLTTKGDLLTRTASASVRLGVGADDEVLTADSTAPEGIAWKPASGGSGGDADTLEGLTSDQFLRSDTSDTYDNGDLTIGGAGQLVNTGDPILTDQIQEYHAASGVNVQGVLCKGAAGAEAAAYKATGTTPATFNENGIDRVSAAATTFNVQNSGAGAMTLQVDGNTVWHAGNDGTGSGLDADTVDSKNPGSANGLATLDGSSKVVEDPANATATPTANKIPIADGSGLLDGWVTAVPDSTYYRGGNMTMNWPVVTGQTTLPEWWDDETHITTTVTTCTTETITKKPDERIFKHVTDGSGSNVAAYQRLTIADHQGYAVSEPLSCSRWVYQAGSNTITLELKDSTGATIGSATTTASATWTLLKVQNKTPTAGSTYVDQRVKVNANSVTIYSTSPMLHIGTAVKPFEVNPLVWVEAFDDTISTDPANTNFTTASFATPAHPLACILNLAVNLLSTGGSRSLRMEPSYGAGSTTAIYNVVTANPAANVGIQARVLCNCSDTQVIQWRVSNADVSTLNIALNGYFRFTY